MIQVYGLISNDSTEYLSYIHIIVKNSRRGTVSDKSGFYSIVARESDTLVFSCIGYKRKRFVIPSGNENQFLWQDIRMIRDTILLKEATVYSWISYQTFVADVAAYNPPDDDMTRANKNLESLQKMIISGYNKGEYPVDADLNYKYTMQQRYNQMYSWGQIPTYNIFNPIAWAQFFKALFNGDLNSK